MSSDSEEDDCYGNVALTLQKIKSRYREDIIDTTNLLNESNELEDIITKTALKMKNKPKVPTELINDIPTSVNVTDSSTKTVNKPTKRMTRSATKPAGKGVEESPTVPETLPSAKKSRSRKSATVDVTPATTSGDTSVSARGHRAARGRTPRRNPGRQRRSEILNILDSYAEIINVGNTDEYPDSSDTQRLFSKVDTSNDVVTIEDEANSSMNGENEEMSVKVYWQNCDYFKFTIRRYQKLTQIFNFLSNKASVDQDKLLLTYNDRILKPDDTPDSIDYNICKFIDGGVVKHSVADIVKKNKSSNIVKGIIIRFQFQNTKKQFVTEVNLDETLAISMMKCAEHLEVPIDKLKFVFDGDSLCGKQTPRQLEFEGGECIDVKIVN